MTKDPIVLAQRRQGSPMQVGVNMLWCRPGRVGGVEEYLCRQLAGLAAVDPTISALLAAPPGFAEAHPELQRFDVAVGRPFTVGLAGRLLEEIRWLPRLFREMEVVHHGNGTVPASSRKPILLTITDLQYRQFPQYFSPARLNYLRWMIPRSAKRASLIAVLTEFVRNTVIEAFNVDAERVVVVPHSAGVVRAANGDEEAELRARYGLGTARLLVYPAVTYPHKGHRFLIELLAGPLAREDFLLVFLGGPGRAERAVSEAIAKRGVADRVVRLGRVPDADRDGLISIATAVVFPSEYEGFGAPVIEAMALGTPVICSDRAALPEVAGDAAILLPLDLDAWAGALKYVAADPAEMVARGHRRAATFSMESSGAALARAYRLTAEIG